MRTLAFSSDIISPVSQVWSQAATHVGCPAFANGATARCRSSGSSSRASSSKPASAARSRPAGALGSVTRCQLRSCAGITATTVSARGSMGAVQWPWRTTETPSLLST